MATFKNNRQLTVIGAMLVAITAVLTLGVVTSNASSTDGTAANERRASLANVEEGAIAMWHYGIQDGSAGPWCDAMTTHHGNWDAFSDQIEGEAAAWRTTPDGMFRTVGVATQAMCPDTVAAFLASTA